MAARLEWKDCDLNLGAFNLAYVTRNGSTLGRWRMVILPVAGISVAEHARYESEADARQDCESEVRRLLKESGVDCE